MTDFVTSPSTSLVDGLGTRLDLRVPLRVLDSFVLGILTVTSTFGPDHRHDHCPACQKLSLSVSKVLCVVLLADSDWSEQHVGDVMLCYVTRLISYVCRWISILHLGLLALCNRGLQAPEA